MRRRHSDYLAAARRGFLATSPGGSDTVTVVPVCFVHRGESIYTAIDLKPKGDHLSRLSNIASNPSVAFVVDNYSEDWRLLSYLLIHGDAFMLVGEEASEARELLLRKYPQYRWLVLGDAPVMAIRIRRAKFWEFQKRPVHPHR
jgi:PPOX class probable F420-dependent enzyme